MDVTGPRHSPMGQQKQDEYLSSDLPLQGVESVLVLGTDAPDPRRHKIPLYPHIQAQRQIVLHI